MTIAPEEAAGKSTYKDTTYYFCAAECKRKFDADPESFGVDCGGVCGPCGPGDACTVDADCQSGVCEDQSCCGGDRVDCTRCARRLATTINCNSNGPAAAPNCEAFLDCLAANPGACPIRYAPGCSDEPGSVCDNRLFGGTTGPGVGLADAILGSAQCTF